MPEQPRILLVRFSSIGDVLLTTPLIRVLRARYPGAMISALTKAPYAPLLADNPHLNDILRIDARHSVARLAREIRQRNYTHLLDLHGNLRSRVLRLLVPGRWSGFDARRKARRLLIRYKRNSYRSDVPVPERYFEAAASLGVTPDGLPAELHLHPMAQARAEEWLGRQGLNSGTRFVAVAPGAAHSTKRWPPDYWRQLVRQMSGEGYGVVALGGADDGPLCASIIESASGPAVSAAGALGLQETGAVLRHAAAAVAGDTGVMHIATAVGTPVAAMFGPTVREFGFFPYLARARVLERDLGCRPCSSKGTLRCPLAHHRCLREIAPDEVAAAVRELSA